MTQPYKQRRNFFAFGFDYISFASALAFLNLNTILPTFVSRMGLSTALVGLLSTILMVAWALPQAPAGNIAARQEKKKPLLMKAVLLGRPVTLAIPAILLITHADPPWIILATILIGFTFFFASDAFASVPWLDLLGRAFPAERRGQVISMWQVGKAVAVLGISALVSYLLGASGPPFPTNYVWIFGGVTLCLGISTVAILFLYEPPVPENEPATTHIPWRDFGRHLHNIWRQDSRFRLLAVARITFSLSAMSFPFYVLYATNTLYIPDATIGVFIFAQTVGASLASVILGRMADQHGAQRVIIIGTIIATTAPLLALGFSLGGLNLRWLYVWIYVCIGLADNLIMLGYLNYMFDIIPAGQRPIYMGAFNAIGAIGVLGPSIAGWLLGLTSYAVLFAISLGFGLLTLGLAIRLPRVRGIVKSVVTD